MQLDRARIVDQQFTDRLKAQNVPLPRSQTSLESSGLTPEMLLSLFHSQMITRHLDIQARLLREKDLGFYTIGSAGHEGNAAIALAVRPSDMAFLHYRSGAFVIQRAKQQDVKHAVYDQLLSLVASSDDPISGGRHKVFGSLELNIPPQTSIIASHLPKAVGAALSITLSKSIKNLQSNTLKKDSIIVCSFGDGSANHSTAQGAFNAVQWSVDHGVPLPLLFVCEDNGISISVPTKPQWIAQNFKSRKGLVYLSCDGRNLADVFKVTKEAEAQARKGIPVFLHFRTTRLLGHAGSDIESQYRSLQEMEQHEADDPLLHTARMVLQEGLMSTSDILKAYETARQEVQKNADLACSRPQLTSKEGIMASLLPKPNSALLRPLPDEESRERVFAKTFPQLKMPRNLCQNINTALSDLMIQYPQIVVFGEDVGKKGGVYRVTQDLQSRFGQARVFDTLLDEQTILGTAIGLAHNGFLPIPEIQFLAYTHNAADQIRGEAATLSYFSNGQFTNPMVIRIAGLGYQKGFGGHFHNDNALGFLREIPGIVIACPSTASDGARLLKRCVEIALTQQRVVVFLEPIALYMTKDLHTPGDNRCLEVYPKPMDTIDPWEVGVEGTGELALISYGNGAHLSRQASEILKEKKISTRVIDLRWLHSLPEKSLKTAIKGCTKLLIVDECRRTGSLSEGLITWAYETLDPLPAMQRVTAEDCFIPIGKSWQYVLPSVESIVSAALELHDKKPQQKRSRTA